MLPSKNSTPGPLAPDAAYALCELPESRLPALTARARRVRECHFGGRITFSPKVFLPLTNLCRNRCDYCSFRKAPGEAGARTMDHAEVEQWLTRAASQGCSEALLCIGDKPEGAFGAYRRRLADLGHDSTVDYLDWASRAALAHGLLPHTNAGVLSKDDMTRLRRTNVSLGLMLENVSSRLCEPGMPHHRAPDKRPAVRLQMLREAGELRVPLTTGILVGIGETRRERIESLLAIRDLHAEYGHIQEVIVQNFTPRPGVPMASHPEPGEGELLHAIAMARLILPGEVSVQAPPNLNAARTGRLLEAGINDFGGISPVSPDYINPRHPWPVLSALAASCRARSLSLAPRLPIYSRYVEDTRFIDGALLPAVRRAQAQMADAPSILGLDGHGADTAPPHSPTRTLPVASAPGPFPVGRLP